MDNPADPGLNGWLIQLLDTNGNVVATQVTSGTGASAGAYSFTGVAPGTYTVVETPEPNWAQSYPALQQSSALTITRTTWASLSKRSTSSAGS